MFTERFKNKMNSPSGRVPGGYGGPLSARVLPSNAETRRRIHRIAAKLTTLLGRRIIVSQEARKAKYFYIALLLIILETDVPHTSISSALWR
ncbi:hypothetical protein Zmor_009875 [Zophobas morio]|uniref:Uncharacterized protein n=1 Tax=Zophobas morio TaxID=2755281 RepID=A0AA38MJ00_9CUCU|nr:hypothetical protein Zmor_009875 [Zophobas morio]